MPGWVSDALVMPDLGKPIGIAHPISATTTCRGSIALFAMQQNANGCIRCWLNLKQATSIWAWSGTRDVPECAAA